jgi:teichuronic acid biosynthesis glycosyltransferase TuaC
MATAPGPSDGSEYGARIVAEPSRVLVLARSYPNSQFPTLGVWTQRMVVASTGGAQPTVIAPVPYVPPGVPLRSVARFRAVEREQTTGGVRVLHPRIPVGPGHLLHSLDARLAYPFIRRTAVDLARQAPFDVVHAHFIYPDGVIAARLGRELGIPVVVSEHSVWRPWLDREPAVRRQVEAALPGIARVTAVSDVLRRNIEEIVQGRVPVDVLPNVVDDDVFVPAVAGEATDPNQLLFVGTIRHVKGLDLLVRALALVAPRWPDVHLAIAGGAFYRTYARDEQAVRALVHELGLTQRVRFLGERTSLDVAREMRRSVMLVVPSRRETFSLVTAEALACGTPVVATRCGGPEELLTPELGRLVANESVEALADGIMTLHAERHRFDGTSMRAWAVSRFGRAVVGRQLADLYSSVAVASSEKPLSVAGT